MQHRQRLQGEIKLQASALGAEKKDKLRLKFNRKVLQCAIDHSDIPSFTGKVETQAHAYV